MCRCLWAPVTDLSHPGVVMARLEEIERELAERQNAYERAARYWYQAQREIGRVKATALLTADEKSVTEKKARGDLAAYGVEGAECEAEYEALKAAIKVREQRAMICQSLLKAHGRV